MNDYPKVRVLQVLGYPRSGTTLLGLLLAESTGAPFVGELCYFWDRWSGMTRCGCGQRVRDCDEWQAVAHQLAGSHDVCEVDRSMRRVAQWQRRMGKRRARRAGPHDNEALGYLLEMEALYQATAARFGSDALVDSSKLVADAAVLNCSESVEPWFVHLVRDPRATVHSRTVARSSRRAAKRHPRPTLSRLDWYWAVADALSWRSHARACCNLRNVVPTHRWQEVRYEDFAADPLRGLNNITAWFTGQGGPGTEDPGFELAANHAVAGNPLRFRRGALEVKPDVRWQGEMPRVRARAVALTASLGSQALLKGSK